MEKDGVSVISVLVVDDEPEILEATCFSMKMTGYEVHGAANGVEAVQRIQQHGPKVILMDYKLPDMTGLGLIQTAKAESPDSICIVISGLVAGVDEVEGACRRAGASAFLHKPLQISEVKKAIEEALNGRKKD